MTLLELAPARLQRSRRRGYRIPQGAAYVGRPSRWGSPFAVGSGPGEYGRIEAVRLFRIYAEDSRRPADWLEPLRGRDLVCWCALGRPCHADILLELANRP
ncbi:MAG: DUF4326 domain-containing protein [Chloroflexi bacterium]|nr:DUF4326 domain-containing protein [Chloroflexota bacterium]